nr:immunoglobulin heavy chain junction region [Macaca mulatta]MOV52266.1 immunoglobulin heavy chain junction region [Macaca mulatta]
CARMGGITMIERGFDYW